MVVSVIVKTGVLICFTGVDGSGKTTHAKDLVSFLHEKGYSSKYVWDGSRPVLLYLFLGVTRVLGYWKTVKRGDWMDPLEKAPSHVREKLGILYRFLLYLDFNIITSLKIRIPIFFGKIVICDRYIYDLIMELMLSHLYTFSFGKLLLYTTPTPQKVFLVDTQLSIIIRRRPNSNQERLWAKRNTYRKLAKIFDFQIVDTLMTLKDNRERIQREVSIILNQ